MSTKKALFLVGGLLLLAALIAACGPSQPGPAGEPGPAGPAGPAGPQGEAGAVPSAADLTCTECHNDTTLLVSKAAQFESSLHGTGESFVRGAGATCAGCHGTEGAKARINAGLPPHDPLVVGVTNVSPFGCRTCHNVHATYTGEDWARTGSEQPVKFEYSDGTFDGGEGNLCANCHQIRNAKPTFTAGNIEITSARFGTHYGTEAQMLFGEGGLGLSGSPSAHYTMVENTCVACHMGEEYNHTYLPKVARCQDCHADVPNFDVNGVQTEITAMLEELHAIFVEKGMLNPETDLWNASASAPLKVPEAVANAMWNYKFVTYDQSMGVHNPAYAKALLEAALEALK